MERYKYNFQCRCGWDNDYAKLAEAKKDAKLHKKHQRDGVYIDQINTNPSVDEDWITGRYWRV